MIFFNFPIKIPTYTSSTDTWSSITYNTKEEFLEVIQSQFKIPGNYNLKNTDKWKERALEYTESCNNPSLENGFYTRFSKGTSQATKFWLFEKEKIINGAFFDGQYVSGMYYWYLNYCPIQDSVRGKKSFPLVMDNDMFFYLYIMLCILKGKHAVVLKARQKGYSLKIMSILYWSYTWFAGTVNTIGAIDEEKVKKSWQFIERYRNHNNKNTSNYFRRGPVRPKALEWYERIDLADGGFIGQDSTLKGTTFQKSPEQGVGGAQTIFFYEEAGIAPTLLDTLGFIRPALEKGSLTTGLIIASGALGELDDAEDLKEIFYSPEAHNFLGMENVWDKNPPSDSTECGLFISEAYNLEGDYEGIPFYDKDGNSNVEHSMKYIKESKDNLKSSNKKASLVQLDISQKLTSPEEGFADRKTGFFQVPILRTHLDRLNTSKPKLINCELYEDKAGEIKFSHVEERFAITEFPFKGMEDTDKRGCVQIYELPKCEKGSTEPTARTYFAGVDPIQTDITTTSNSLFCIYIFKNITRVKYKDPETNEIKTKTEGYKPVAWYIGRYEDRKQTNTQAEYLLRFYNAFALVENNVTSFIDHMRQKNLENKYLMTAIEARKIYGEDIVNDSSSLNRAYGIHMSSTGKLKVLLLNKMKEYVGEIIDVVRKPDNEIVRTIYGVDRVADIGLTKEMIGYRKGINTDRLVGFGLALAACELYMTSGVISDIDETDTEPDIVKIPQNKMNFFSSEYTSKKQSRSPFSKRMKYVS